MKSWRIMHVPFHENSNSHNDETWRSHTSEDRENLLEVQKSGYEPPAWVDVSRQILTPLAFIAQLVTSACDTASVTHTQS